MSFEFEFSPAPGVVGSGLLDGRVPCVQEALTNVARHANASNVTVTIQESAGRLVCEVVDDGRGITQDEISDPESLELLGMRHRTALLKGKLAIHGGPGKGKRVTVTIPLGERQGH